MTARPLRPLVFFLDESIDSESVTAALRQAGVAVVRSSVRFDRGTKDEVWLAEAGRNKWVVLTRDKRIRYRQLERLALQQSRVRSFVFTGGNVTVKDTAATLVAAMALIERIARSNPGPFIYHIGRAGKPLKMQ